MKPKFFTIAAACLIALCASLPSQTHDSFVSGVWWPGADIGGRGRDYLGVPGLTVITEANLWCPSPWHLNPLVTASVVSSGDD